MKPISCNSRRALQCELLALLIVTMLGQPGKAVAEEQNGMILIPTRKVIVGTSDEERRALAKQYDCHPTWLSDELPRREVELPAFWIDRYPVTNAQYLAFVQATKQAPPSWWNRFGGVFPKEYADHPVVGLGAQDAVAYAKWAGKRLPRPEEWEAAVAGAEHTLFAWGDAWPGPLKHVGEAPITSDRPGTRPVGSGECGRSAAGVEDFAGQVLEWSADARPHNSSQHRMVKGASWIHQDPLNFRVACGYYASENWQSLLVGVRCALDGKEAPPKIAQAQAKGSQPSGTRKDNDSKAPSFLTLEAGGNRGARNITIRVPKFDIEGINLMAPETIMWNRASVLGWRQKPDLTWTERTPQRAVYDLTLPELRMHAEFLVHDDYIEQRFTAKNPGEKPGSFRTSTCFKLQSSLMFYDPEQLRTYALGADGKFVSVRKLPRGGDSVRWINRFSGEELKNQRWALLAVVSRDKRRVIAAGMGGPATEFSDGSNSLFTCLHTESTIQVPAGQEATSRELFWFLEGTLDDLLRRFHKEFPPKPE
jgi:formylglycine-generating enzyme required for sulfatase activity